MEIQAASDNRQTEAASGVGRRRHTVSLLGPNGAGKTTTMGCIVGLRGDSLTTATDEIVDLFDLGPLTERRVKDLSVGQQKLVHLATAVIHEPRLLLVDEPTAGLDVSARQRVIDGIRRLAAQGTAVIFSTHYLEEADEACDSLVIIDHGRRVAAGSMGFSFFREHGRGTWDRLRIAPIRTIEIVVGKALPMLAVTAAQQFPLVAVGIATFGVEVPGGAAQLVITALACAATYVTLAIAMTSLCRTMSQLNAASMLGTMAVAGAGGAIAQVTALPGWVQAIAPASPVYWAIDAYRSVLAGEQGFGRAIAMPLGFTALFIAITLWRFRADKPKENWLGE